MHFDEGRFEAVFDCFHRALKARHELRGSPIRLLLAFKQSPRSHPAEWMLLLLSSCLGMLELGGGEGGSLFEFGVCAGSDLESS